MARRRKAGPKRKKGPRTKSGRLSRASKDLEVRDYGTREFCEKRGYVLTAPSRRSPQFPPASCWPTNCISSEQHRAAQRYSWAHAVTYGRVWRAMCPRGDPVGTEPPARMQEIAKDELGKMNRRLTKAERRHVANVADLHPLRSLA